MRSLTARKKSKNGTHRLPWGSFFVCHNNFFTKQCGDWMDETKCVFCEIVEGTKSARIVYETDSVIAMIDPRQAIPGHILVIPKEHFQDIYALSEEAGFGIMKAMILLSQTVKKAFALDGLSIWQSNGPGAHQEVPHVHFHIHPRMIDDGLLRVYPRWLDRLPDQELDSYAERIRQALIDN